ncbi:MAG TPA: L-threonylcarbamoyladenylate synthase [Paludibacteraceae bacterium]|jgi:tRNA threonylcarbamoyl adenosine modification protein (Sua5/YciO/YrdC/YwlC family)|nr:threonylcarbamoyl-AMP synthase [Paludibacteraceae bacterium]MBP8967108.1 threonylcarbamoyl-AMP synthase [Paludibacteraceae bacterium]HOF98062.1 L-threonylcarbamoyladenylate synthase [Paludibacteraceae bacterium]HOJ65410.1 L-threonylcarbamoyladenylate synthase [Paludibacteraceae bacterium]HOL28736.1 L-threonylcarbamoyladenylate synthase [Paludibacteraceae bacterium]
MLIKIYETNPNPHEIHRVIETLRDGGTIIFPTDTVYAFGCSLFNKHGIEYIARIKKKDLRSSQLSFVCESIKQISEYTKLDDETFKLIKKNLPGPFTFILKGNHRLPKLFKDKKTVGIRMPKNNIALTIVHELGNPLMTSSIFYHNNSLEYIVDPEMIEEKYGHLVDLVIDGGPGGYIPSTIVDCTCEEPVILRQGAGELIW